MQLCVVNGHGAIVIDVSSGDSQTPVKDDTADEGNVLLQIHATEHCPLPLIHIS